MTVFDIIAEFEQSCVRLYESEESEDYDSVGDAYISLSHLLRELYPGLSLSLLRTGEVIMQDKTRIDKLITIRLEIVDAFLALARKCFSKKEESQGAIFYEAANKMCDVVNDYLIQCGYIKHKDKLFKRELTIEQFSPIKCHVAETRRNRQILDIIEEIAIEEELYSVDQKPPNESFLPIGHYAENRYLPMSYSNKERDKVVLAPTGIIMGRLYRGEGRYHKICKSSLYT